MQLLVVFVARAVAAASQATNANSSIFNYPTGHGNLTYAVSAATSGDVYMNILAPAAYQWVGVGTGSEMAGSVMFILYEGADKNSECSSYCTEFSESRLPDRRRDLVATTLGRP